MGSRSGQKKKQTAWYCSTKLFRACKHTAIGVPLIHWNLHADRKGSIFEQGAENAYGMCLTNMVERYSSVTMLAHRMNPLD